MHKPQKILGVLLALLVVFAANMPLLQSTWAALPDFRGSEFEDPWDEDPTDDTDYSYTPPTEEPTEPFSIIWPDDDPDDDTEDDYTYYTQPSTNNYTPTEYSTDSEQTDTPTPSRYIPPTAAPQPSQTAAAPAVPETTTAQAIASIIENYAAVEEYFTDTQLDDKTVDSTEKNQNAVHIGGGNVIINNAVITRTNKASTVGEKAFHYGVGAAVLATNGIGYISNSDITTEAKGGTGIFSFGSSKIYAADSTVTTQLENSHGLATAETGRLFAWNMDVTTAKDNSSPVYSGPGGGTTVIDGGSYVSSGNNAPAVYCASDISIANADFTAEQSEAIQVIGSNTITVCDSNLTGNMKIDPDFSSQWTVLLAHTETVEAAEEPETTEAAGTTEATETTEAAAGTENTAPARPAGTTSFFMKNGSLTSKNGGMFYTTNTTSSIYLENVALKPYKNAEFLVRCTGNSDKTTWGAKGKNGAVCNFTAVNQLLEGNIVWDAISELSLYLKDASSLTGAFVKDEKNTRGLGFADLYIGEGCTWTVAGDSELANLYNAGSIADTSGNPVTIKKADGTVISEGTSAYTIVVDSYSDKAILTGAQKAPDWTKVSVVRPAALGASLAEITTEAVAESSTTPPRPDEAYEKRKQIAVYVLIGIGAVAVASLGVWFYQANKYKLKKKFSNNDE